MISSAAKGSNEKAGSKMALPFCFGDLSIVHESAIFNFWKPKIVFDIQNKYGIGMHDFFR
jgi:hypothetical protein